MVTRVTEAQWAALGISLVTSTLIYLRRALVLNVRLFPPRRVHVVTYALSLVAGVMFWVTVNSIQRGVALQLSAGLVSTTLVWTVYVLLVNGSARPPTRSQWISLGFHVVTEASLLMQVRLTIS